jgi:hypothetical protein
MGVLFVLRGDLIKFYGVGMSLLRLIPTYNISWKDNPVASRASFVYHVLSMNLQFDRE